MSNYPCIGIADITSKIAWILSLKVEQINLNFKGIGWKKYAYDKK